MAVDWDDLLLGPVMDVFGEGQATDPSSWPTYWATPASQPFQLPGAVFDREYKRVSDDDGLQQSTSHPVLGVRDAVILGAGLPSPAQGALVFIPSEGVRYSVADVQADGHGHTLLILIQVAS